MVGTKNFFEILLSNVHLFIVRQFEFAGFPDFDETSKTPTKRTYRSQNNHVQLAITQQEKQTIILERIVEQNNRIIDELKDIKEQLKNQNDGFFRY